MTDRLLSWKFAEDFVVERPDIALARQHSVELGIEAVQPSVGAHLALLAAASGAKNIVEIGTGVGVSGLWLLSGAPDAVLTTIDAELDFQQHARRAFTEAGIAANHVRLIGGRALDVLPRMNEGSYDIVLVDADPAGVVEYVEHGLRLVRQGGTVVVAHALWRGKVADPANREEATEGYRLLLREIAASDAVTSALSSIGDGLLARHEIGRVSARPSSVPLEVRAVSSDRDDVREGVVELFGLVIVDRDDQTAATLERYANDDEASFLDSLHRSVSGPGFHGCHRYPFQRCAASIIPLRRGPVVPGHPPADLHPDPLAGNARRTR